MPQNWFEQNAPKKKSWFEENAPKAPPSADPLKPQTPAPSTDPGAVGKKSAQRDGTGVEDQIEVVNRTTGQRGRIPKKNFDPKVFYDPSQADVSPWPGAVSQTPGEAPDASAFQAYPVDKQDLTGKTVGDLKDIMVPRFRPFQARQYHLDPQMLPVNRLLSGMSGRDIAGFGGTVAGSEVGGSLGGAAGAATGFPGAETVGRLGGQFIGAGLTGPTAMRVYDWLKGTPSPTSIPQDIAASVAQQVGQRAIPRLLEKGVQSELLSYLTNKLPWIGGVVGGDIGYHSGVPYGGEIGAAIGAVSGAGLKGTIQAVTSTPEYKALSEAAQRSVISLLQQGETGVALGILARKGAGPVYGALQPQGRTGPTGQPKGPKGTNTALSPQDEQAFRQFIRDRNIVFDPNNPKPDWDARGWWLQNWKQ